MPSAVLLRREIEDALQDRFPAALTPAPRAVREVAATGIAPVDELLDGGLPIGAISELTGPVSSGRTSLAVAFLARRTAEGRVCAWVDVDDVFDPESAAAGGVALPQLLWVRCRDEKAQSQSTGQAQSRKHPSRTQFSRTQSWTRLDQALRSADLLLQAGGFAAIVLDLGTTAREDAIRIPLATWFRFRQAADRARSSLVVLGRAAYAQSSAAVALECSPRQTEIAGGTVLGGFEFAVRRGRMRSATTAIGARKPPISTWTATPAQDAMREAKRCA
jgi:hypothetical protein